MGGRCLHVDQLKEFNVRAQGLGKRPTGRTALNLGERAYPTSVLCPRRFHRLEAGAPGDRGVTALGLVGAVSSSLPGTAHGLSPGMVASTARVAVPASAPATLRTAQAAQVRAGKAASLGRDGGQGLLLERETKVLADSAAGGSSFIFPELSLAIRVTF